MAQEETKRLVENYMTENGYIKLHRSIVSWEWYSDLNTKSVFLHLLLNANWDDSRFRGYEVPKGSLVTSYNSLSKALGISKQSVRTSINHLISTHEITLTSHSHFSIISIVNWEKYQGSDEETNTHINTHSNTELTRNQHATNTIKEYKNIRNKELYISNEQNCRNPEFLKLLEREVKNGEV